MSGRSSAAIAVTVEESSQVGEARRTVAGLAAQLGFDETRAGRLAILATELTTNIVRHGGGGELIVRRLDDERAIEVLALDRGAGMNSVAEALRDGFSTGGTRGTGLGAVSRVADQWDVYSAPGVGTAVVARVAANGTAAPRPTAVLDLGAVCLSRHDEVVCGDAWGIVHASGRSVLMLADGLGHGPEANVAAKEAIRVFREHAAMTPAQIIGAAHLALRGTRGAAVGVAELDLERRAVRFAGVGNIAGTVVAGGNSRSFVSHGGIVGHECRRVHEFDYPWPERALLVLHSDGLQTSWKLDRYPGLEQRHPALVAGVLYRDYARGRDDVTVVACREARPAR